MREVSEAVAAKTPIKLEIKFRIRNSGSFSTATENHSSDCLQAFQYKIPSAMYNPSKVLACYTLDEIEALREKYPDVAGELYTADLVKGELGLGKQISR